MNKHLIYLTIFIFFTSLRAFAQEEKLSLAQINNFENRIQTLEAKVSDLEQKIVSLQAEKADSDNNNDSMANETDYPLTQSDDLAKKAEPVSKNDEAEKEFNEIFALLQKAEDKLAYQKFSDFITKYPEENLSGEALYWLGDISFREKNYKKASVHYLDSYNKFKNGSKAFDSLLGLSTSLALDGDVEKACMGFDSLSKNNRASITIINKSKEELIKFGCQSQESKE